MSSVGVLTNMSGTTPLVTAEMTFWRIGANGMMLNSIVLLLAFW